jgi:hypothetical protein
MEALLSHHSLPSGAVVRLRVPRASDLDGIVALAAQDSARIGDTEAERLVRFDPRSRAVACATVLDGVGETVVGIGAIDLRDVADPDLLVIDDGYGEELQGLLRDVLHERVATHGRRTAADRRSLPRRLLRRARARGHTS